MGEHYEFTDVWTIPAGIEVAWRMVDDVASWPIWWPDYRFAEVISEIRHGPGTRWHVKVRSDLPYKLDFNSRSSPANRPLTSALESRVSSKAKSTGGWIGCRRTQPE